MHMLLKNKYLCMCMYITYTCMCVYNTHNCICVNNTYMCMRVYNAYMCMCVYRKRLKDYTAEIRVFNATVFRIEVYAATFSTDVYTTTLNGFMRIAQRLKCQSNLGMITMREKGDEHTKTLYCFANARVYSLIYF